MVRYEVIQEAIRVARLQRSAYLAEFISGAVVSTLKFLERAGTQAVAVARAKASRNVFTFDA
jgi:hypothetical protein